MATDKSSIPSMGTNVSPCHYAEGSCADQLASYVMGITGSSLGSEVARAQRRTTHHHLAKSLRMGTATVTPQPKAASVV